VTWRRDIDKLEWFTLASSLVLAGASVWAASFPIVSADAWFIGEFAWSLVATLWAIDLLATVDDSSNRGLSLALLLLGLVANPVLVVGALLVGIGGTIGLAFGVALGSCIFAAIAIREPQRRLGWLLAPVVVLSMFAIIATGVPRSIRMQVDEPALTRFAQDVVTGTGPTLPAYFDVGLMIGSIPIYAAYDYDGALRLVTAEVGYLGDSDAELAYFPDANPPPEGRYEHLVGAWYRWSSNSGD
jgi:hypothetical protein